MPTYRVQTDTGIFTVESQTPITSETQMQQVLNGGGQGIKITSEAPDHPVSQGFLQRLNTGFAQQKKASIQRAERYLTEQLTAAGMPPDEVSRRVKQATAQLESASPGSLGDVGRFMLPFLVGRFVPAGRTAARMGGQLLGNVAGSAAIGAGESVLQGQSPLQGVMRGTMQGIPGGVAQATIGGLLGPNKATIQAQQASALARMKNIFSPPVQASLPPDPKAIFSKNTINDMVKTAGTSLDAMETSIRTALAPKAGLGQKGLQAKFDFYRERIKTLRDIGEGPRTTPELRGAAKKASTEAAGLEQELLAMLEKNGFTSQAQLYRTTLQRYAQDRANIRVLKAIQRTQNLPGGVNRADNPDVAELVDSLQAPTLSGAARATFMTALVALRHPFMALHFARSGAGKGFIDPQKVQVPRFGKMAGPLGAVGGAAASLTTKDEPE